MSITFLYALKKYCDHFYDIENFDRALRDENHVWVVHHKLEAFYGQKELVSRGLYYHRPARELIFLRRDAGDTRDFHCYWPHAAKHHLSLPPRSEEHKKHLSEGIRKGFAEGRVVWNKGKPRSEETKRKISETQKRNHAIRKGGIYHA